MPLARFLERSGFNLHLAESLIPVNKVDHSIEGSELDHLLEEEVLEEAVEVELDQSLPIPKVGSRRSDETRSCSPKPTSGDVFFEGKTSEKSECGR